MKKMETRSLTDSVNAVSGYTKFLDKFPGFARFDIERWVSGKFLFYQPLFHGVRTNFLSEDTEASMAGGKKRGYKDAFPEDAQIDESQLSFKVARTIMEAYGKSTFFLGKLRRR